MSSWLRRRRFLAAVGVGIAGSGCLDGVGSDGAGSTPESTSDATPVEPAPDLSVDHDIEMWDRYDPDWEPPESPPTDADLAVEPVIENLEIPWDLEFAPGGDLFVSERVGRISRYASGEFDLVADPDVIDHATAVDPDEDGDWWSAGGEGGLLGIALHPRYPETSVLYAFYTYEADGGLRNRLSYFRTDLEEPSETTLIEGIPGDDIHNGARLTFGPRNYLWVTTGDAGEAERAADPSDLSGSVLRIEPDGTAPADNPEVGDSRVYSYGHRNPQTITFLPDGRPVIAEHGPAARDEVSVLEPGGDYGWPSVRSRGDDDAYGRYEDVPEVNPPLVNTGTEMWAPSGGVFYTGDAVPALRNRLLVGGLGSQRFHAITIAADPPEIGGQRYGGPWSHAAYDAVVHRLFEDLLGRIRHLEVGPDGELYAITSNRDGRADGPFPAATDDRLVRIVQR